MCYIGTACSCDNLPINNSVIDPKLGKRIKNTKLNTPPSHPCRREETSDSESGEDMELVCRFPPAQHCGHRAFSLNPDAEPFTSDLHDQEEALKVNEPQGDWMNNIQE